MARLIPNKVHADIKSAAEKRVYEDMRASDSTSDWIVLHSLGLARHEVKSRSEIDFLVICKKGIFVLEVKGGRVSRQDRVWHTQDRYGDFHKLNESPYDQAASGMRAIRNDIKNKFGKHFFERYLIGYGVVLPNVAIGSIETGSDGEDEITYWEADKREHIGRYIGRVSSYWAKRNPGRENIPTPLIQEISDFLAGDFMSSQTLDSAHEDLEAEIFDWTEDQLLTLDRLDSYKRLVILGSAGTGKTLLAKKEVEKNLSSNKKIIFLCFNKLLGSWLKDNLPEQDNLKVETVHRYMWSLVEEGNLLFSYTEQSKQKTEDEKYWELIPDFACQAFLNLNKEPWDMVIVDEGQDFLTTNILDFIDLILEGGLEEGEWRWFMDNTLQKDVFGKFDEDQYSYLSLHSGNTVLNTNCRNTPVINDEASMLTNSLLAKSFKSNTEALPVEIKWFKNEREQHSLIKSTIESLKVGNVANKDIVILFPRKPSESTTEFLSEIRCSKIEANSQDDIKYATVSSYKGLESKVVIFSGVTDINSDWSRSILYTGMTRARVQLIMLLDHSLYEQYKKLYVARIKKEGNL